MSAPNPQSQVFPPGLLLGFFNTLPSGVPTGQAGAIQIDNTGRLLVASEANKYTYRAAVNSVTPVATPTDFLQIIGSATMTCRIKKLKLQGIATTAGTLPVNIIRELCTLHNPQITYHITDHSRET